jgi:hypothetical protein
MFGHISPHLGGVKFPPIAPAFLGGQRPRFDQRQIIIDRLARHAEAFGRFDFAAARADKTHDPPPQIKTMGFHAFSLPWNV